MPVVEEQVANPIGKRCPPFDLLDSNLGQIEPLKGLHVSALNTYPGSQARFDHSWR